MEGKFLPIGSVVRLKDGQKRLMITGFLQMEQGENGQKNICCLLYTSPSPRDGLLSRMPSSA